MNDITVMFSTIDSITLVQVIAWFIAGVVSFYFSIGNARVWTSISTGFFLIFISQAYTLNPWASFGRIAAIHYIIGTISILLITHGFLEYYVFSRTLEVGGSKGAVYFGSIGVIILSAVFLIINPSPDPYSLRNIKMIENALWVCLSILNLDMLRKIYAEIRDSAIAKGFIAFGIVFFLIFLWKGSELYLQVFQWDKDWLEIVKAAHQPSDVSNFAARVEFSRFVNQAAGILSSVSVAGTFGYLFRLLK